MRVQAEEEQCDWSGGGGGGVYFHEFGDEDAGGGSGGTRGGAGRSGVGGRRGGGGRITGTVEGVRKSIPRPSFAVGVVMGVRRSSNVYVGSEAACGSGGYGFAYQGGSAQLR
jgi:hypothetical protein